MENPGLRNKTGYCLEPEVVQSKKEKDKYTHSDEGINEKNAKREEEATAVVASPRRVADTITAVRTEDLPRPGSHPSRARIALRIAPITSSIVAGLAM